MQQALVGTDRAVVHLHGYWRRLESVVLCVRSYEALLGAVRQALQRAVTVLHSLLLVGVDAGCE